VIFSRFNTAAVTGLETNNNIAFGVNLLCRCSRKTYL